MRSTNSIRMFLGFEMMEELACVRHFMKLVMSTLGIAQRWTYNVEFYFMRWKLNRHRGKTSTQVTFMIPFLNYGSSNWKKTILVYFNPLCMCIAEFRYDLSDIWPWGMAEDSCWDAPHLPCSPWDIGEWDCHFWPGLCPGQVYHTSCPDSQPWSHQSQSGWKSCNGAPRLDESPCWIWRATAQTDCNQEPEIIQLQWNTC